ncbi:hypothetical protein T4C_4317 [Trichinella pseudospiralis]|uniref:Uncharacterized protein n=1 Tax=Trichinella pseudospiralis TaxID=6337 RepID=A0A0V1JLD6_TRIPS|nr:hypothetical protein T4C_4317 [Trichinella pseudospiralis]
MPLMQRLGAHLIGRLTTTIDSGVTVVHAADYLVVDIGEQLNQPDSEQLLKALANICQNNSVGLLLKLTPDLNSEAKVGIVQLRTRKYPERKMDGLVVGIQSNIVKLYTIRNLPNVLTNGKVPIVACGAIDDFLDTYEMIRGINPGSDDSNLYSSLQFNCTALQWLCEIFNLYEMLFQLSQRISVQCKQTCVLAKLISKEWIFFLLFCYACV